MEKLAGIVKSLTAPSTNMLWLYKNELRAFNNGRWVTLGPISEDNEIEETNNSIEHVELLVGNSKKTKTHNLSKLIEGHLFIHINNNYGVCTWSSKDGGVAHITENGNNVYYSITSDGAVTKEITSPDIYLEYVRLGGKLGPSEFVSDLIALIG